MQHRIAVTSLALLASALIAARPAERSVQGQTPSIAGSWQLNEQKSEKYDPSRERALSQGDATGGDLRTGQGRSSGGGRSVGSATGGGGGGSGGGSSGGGNSAPMSHDVMRVMREATTQPKMLKIEQTDSSVTIQAGPRPLTVLTNGHVSADSTVDGEIAYAVKATWKNGQLIVERQINNGATMMRQTYYLDKKDPKMLIVDVRFEDKGSRRTIDNRRVYNLGS